MARAHLDVEPEQLVRGQEERRGEALDLQRPPELAAEAVRDAVRRQDDERQEDEERRRRRARRGTRAPRAGRAAARRTRARAARARPGRASPRRRARAGRSRAGGAPRASAASAASTSAIGQRSKRVRTTEPSRSGKTAIAASVATTLVRVAPSAARMQARAEQSRAPRREPSVPSNARRYACWSPLSVSSAGSTKIGNAAGGYSSRKSRYGIDPRSIAFPYVS